MQLDFWVKSKPHSVAVFLCPKITTGSEIGKKQIKKSPHEAGKITGFYRGFLHRDITQHLDGSKVSNALYGFVIAR